MTTSSGVRFSVVIPMYNVEKTIINTLDSVILSKEEINLVLVDDCSEDDTIIVVKKYLEEKAFVNYTIIKNEKNSGVSTTRNNGLRLVPDNDYVLLLDAGDSLTQNALAQLGQLISKFSNPDVIRFGNTQSKEIFTEIKQVQSFNNIDASIIESYYLHSSCTQVFKKSLLSGIEFREDIRFAEDMLFVFESLQNANSIILIPNQLYVYSFNQNSASNRINLNHIITRLDAISLVYSEIINSNINETLRKIYIAKRNRELSQQLLKVRLISKKEYNNEIARYKKLYIDSEYKWINNDIFALHSKSIVKNNVLLSHSIEFLYYLLKRGKNNG